MADSLFDGRYRYDYIYPRGRSGETLRAVDTQDNDRPVVIKRPAPNDAPPIRAGQEVSILNERKALTRLAGHEAVTALVGNGQYLVGGTAHQYIAMERAEGKVLADTVLELEARGERLPELEMLVIIERLLDLLQTAHAHDIVYNDVDAKHLFWDREHYRLKVIDWGNAVFLEGDESTPQGVSRQSDVYQVGELLFFIVSGGGRVEVPRDSANQTEEFRLNFGEDAERVAPRLQAIISKAVHPNLRFRYRTIADLRKDLSEYRSPIERERNAIVGRVSDRLRRDRSKDELQGLLQTLEPAAAMDPGFPEIRRVEQEIHDRLADLAVGADLDAARIYMESGNWPRAASLLDELRHRVKGSSSALIRLLRDWAKLLIDSDVQPAPPAIIDAIVLAFDGHSDRAASLLLADSAVPAVEWLMAERVTAYMPDVVLLRPNLYRIDTALARLTDEGMAVMEARAMLADVNETIDKQCGASVTSMGELRAGFQRVNEQLGLLATLLETLNANHNLPDRRLPISSLGRARHAAALLSDQVQVIGQQATASPRDTMAALDSARAMNPLNPVWDVIAQWLDGLYERLGAYQTYVPAADGSDIETWLQTTQTDLVPFAERLFDDLLTGMVRGLGLAAQAWSDYASSAVQGNRVGAVGSLVQAAESVSAISPTLAGWFGQLRSIVANAQYVERHALYGVLGRALADGWEAFDRGKLSEAEQLGQRALEISHSEAERFASTRLRTLIETARGWLERNGIGDAKRTQATLEALEGLYTAEEHSLRENFAAQMPSKETYLKAMNKGLVDLYARNSTAAVRILFFNYILLGALDAQEGALEDAGFWREAAVKTLGDYGPRHVATRALDDFVQRRRDLNAAAALLNTVNGPQILASLESTRKALEENPQSRTLSAAVYSLRELEAAVRDWSDGEFRAAGSKLENALRGVGESEQAGAITLTGYRAWLVDLLAASAELYAQSRKMAQTVEQKPDHPVDAVRHAHQHQVEVTQRMLGDSYAASLRQWRDTYQNFLSVYTDSSLRRSAKLSRFNELFRAMFIDRHPAYALYRHWYNLTENAPEFPAPPTSEPTPRIAEGSEVNPDEYKGSRYADVPPETPDELPRSRPRPRGRTLAFIGIGVLLLLGGGYLVMRLMTNCCTPPPSSTPTLNPTVTLDDTGTARALAITLATPTRIVPPATVPPPITPTPLPGITVSPLPLGETYTPAAPTDTYTPAPTATPLPTNTATITPTFTATALPPQGLQGDQDLLALAGHLTPFPWSSDQFSLVQAVEGAYWRLGVGEVSGTPETTTGSGMIAISLPADLLETYYGNNAATRIRRMRATLTLTTSNPTLMPENEVYFGAALQSASDPSQTVGLNVQVPQLGVINLGQRSGDQVQVVSQRSVSAIVARIRLERDLDSGKVTIFFNDEQLGDPLDFGAAQDGVLPVLFVRAGGVIVSVTDWSISLR